MSKLLDRSHSELLTPDQILSNAERLYALENQFAYRAVILEAITALEAFVHVEVFSNLAEKFDTDFVNWLEQTTRMRFDDRLLILLPVASEIEIDKKSKRWADLVKAREIRNKIAHGAQKATRKNAGFVLDTVRDWLAFVSRTTRLERALLEFKRYIESNNITISNESEANTAIWDFFGDSVAWISEDERLDIPQSLLFPPYRSHGPDVSLQFGNQWVVFEYKLVRNSLQRADNVLEQMRQYLGSIDRDFAANVQGVVIAFQHSELVGFDEVQKYDNGSIYLVVIKV